MQETPPLAPPGPFTLPLPRHCVHFAFFYPLQRTWKREIRGGEHVRQDGIAAEILAYFKLCRFVVVRQDEEVPPEYIRAAIRAVLLNDRNLADRKAASDETYNLLADALVVRFQEQGFSIVKRRPRPCRPGEQGHAGTWPEHWHPPAPLPRLRDWTL